MPELRLSQISKRFGSFQAVSDLNLQVGDGEFVCLLGPSGCGKTTTLRIIAGFETADTGQLLLDGIDITATPPNRRDIGLVFQHYALFPHKTVAENVGFGLKMRGKSRADIDAAVARTLQLVRLSHLSERLPRQLSGGQQQRVALARALAFRPRLLLMDEPLSNLDAQLRDEMRDEIRRVQHEVGTTTIFVTHDQSEALALADRIAVFSEGQLLQYSDPASLYEQPSNRTVGRFIGKMNELEGTVVENSRSATIVSLASGAIVTCRPSSHPVGAEISIMVRFECISISARQPQPQDNNIEVTVEARTYLGSIVEYRCSAEDGVVQVRQGNNSAAEQLAPGNKALLSWSAADTLLFSRQ